MSQCSPNTFFSLYRGVKHIRLWSQNPAYPLSARATVNGSQHPSQRFTFSQHGQMSRSCVLDSQPCKHNFSLIGWIQHRDGVVMCLSLTTARSRVFFVFLFFYFILITGMSGWGRRAKRNQTILAVLLQPAWTSGIIFGIIATLSTLSWHCSMLFISCFIHATACGNRKK